MSELTFHCSRCKQKTESLDMDVSITAMYYLKGQYDDHGAYKLCVPCGKRFDKFLKGQ